MRQLAQEYKQIIDWSAVEPLLSASFLDLPAIQAALASLIDNETFTASTIYDALNRPVTKTMPDDSIIKPAYNEANLLEKVDVNLRGSATITAFVTNIDYNAKGQRDLIEYGNGVKTDYEYDALTFRLVHQHTARGSDDLQDLFYTYDPTGNIAAIRDDAQQTVYFRGGVVRPDGDYTYDAIYRLIRAKGREHIGQASQPWTTSKDEFRTNLQHPNDGKAMRRYAELYEYDEVGNFLHFIHHASGGDWVRDYAYNEPSLIEPGLMNNRLSKTIIGSGVENYTYDAHGSMTSMPHLPEMDWDFKDQLQSVDLGSGGKAYYVYDSSGQRVRKVIELTDGRRNEERLYIGGFEVYRKYDGRGDAKLERETLHIMDDKRRIALVETRTKGDDPSPEQVIRYQFGNHLGSASLELDDKAQIISYEEYYPYGSTAYQAVRSQTEKGKRYRYTGKERDEESGLYYHGARYYSAWLGRWMNCDPIGMGMTKSLYAYVSNNPIRYNDPDGKQESEPQMPPRLRQLWEAADRANFDSESVYKLIQYMNDDISQRGFSTNFTSGTPLSFAMIRAFAYERNRQQGNYGLAFLNGLIGVMDSFAYALYGDTPRKTARNVALNVVASAAFDYIIEYQTSTKLLTQPKGTSSSPATPEPTLKPGPFKPRSPDGPGNQKASVEALANKTKASSQQMLLPLSRQEFVKSLIEEHSGLNPTVAKDATLGARSVAGKNGPGADVRLFNGGGREVAVHSGKFTSESIGKKLLEEEKQIGTTEIYLQINQGSREGFLKMLPEIRNGYNELGGVFVKIYGANGEIWWSGTFRGIK